MEGQALMFLQVCSPLVCLPVQMEVLALGCPSCLHHLPSQDEDHAWSLCESPPLNLCAESLSHVGSSAFGLPASHWSLPVPVQVWLLFAYTRKRGEIFSAESFHWWSKN